MNDAQKGFIRELYDDVLATLRRNPGFDDTQAMRVVAQKWYNHKFGPFTILLELYGEENPNHVLWGNPIVRFEDCGHTRVTRETLLPFEELPLGIDDFGDGDSFFDMFEWPTAGLREDGDGSGDEPDDDYHRLTNEMAKRNEQLNA